MSEHTDREHDEQGATDRGAAPTGQLHGPWPPPPWQPAGLGTGPEPAPRRRPGRVRLAIAGATAAAVLAVGGIGFAAGHAAVGGSSPTTTSAQVPDTDDQTAPGGTTDPGDGGYASGLPDTFGGDLGAVPGLGSFGAGGLGGTDTSTDETADATAAQVTGLVDVTTEVGYGEGEAAGTGMVLTSDGEVLTNHHVVEGATAIEVRVVATDQTYTATVVGTDADADVAVLQLEDASGLDTVPLGSAGDVAVGDAVTGVGNAGGDGGTATASAGTVTALDQPVSTQAEGSAAAERLTGLIEVDADIVSGDSGGALLDADGDVVGMNTAASSGGADVSGYAIPIDDALAVADQITSGDDSGAVELGYPAFLGVEVTSEPTGSGTTAGAAVAGAITGTPADDLGLAAGDVVTSVDGERVADADALTSTLATYSPGDQVTIGWTDTSGATRSGTATLTAGPVA